MKVYLRTLACLLFSFGVLTLQAADAPRSRESLNQGWRFHQGDPEGNSICLDYDLRPEVTEARDDKAADSKPEEAAARAASSRAYLKPWILPCANDFIRDPAKRHLRPAGNPGADVPFVSATFDDRSWIPLTLPHDWAIAGPFLQEGNHGGMGRLPSWGIGWYRRKLHLPREDQGKKIFLEIDGAMSYASVWVNGQLVGGWPYGYSSWSLDLSAFVRFGEENQIAIRLDNPPSSSRWYPGGGIYRNVWLTKCAPIHIPQWGVHLQTLGVQDNKAQLSWSVRVNNSSTQAVELSTETSFYLLDEKGVRADHVAAVARSSKVQASAGQQLQVEGSCTLDNPKLWGPRPTQTPHLYVAVTRLLRNGDCIDQVETRFGIRTLQFDPRQGLLVNGELIKIHGVNQHHDLGALGAAYNERAAQRQLETLSSFGCNAVRMSHNPPAPELLDLCDRLGFLVMDEAFDVWERKKTPLDHHLIFADWSEADLRALVRRDRNHPSVIIWSIGNEVGEQYTAAAGAAVAKRLVDIVHQEDSTRPVTSAMNFAKPDMELPAEMDLISLNYQGEGIRQSPEFEGTERIRTAPQYLPYARKFPGKVILTSESASAFSTRGSYLFPVTKESSAYVRDVPGGGGDSQKAIVSAYELHCVDFGSSAEKVFRSLDSHPFVAGDFVWTGWDHLGEPTPYYSSRSSYCGIVDMAGFRKDRFYLYQSRWLPDLPMVHILPHWTWPERVGQVTPVHVFTSGDEAELFLNGKSLGRRGKKPGEYRIRWDEVCYEPGVLEVVAYRKGQKWATDSVRTAGAAVALEAKPDRSEIKADGLDLSFIAVRVVDDQGNLSPRAMHQLRFEVEGCGEFVASDNGDPTNFEPFPLPTRKAFNGLCLVIVRAKAGKPGQIRVKVSAEGMKAAVVTLDAKP